MTRAAHEAMPAAPGRRGYALRGERQSSIWPVLLVVFACTVGLCALWRPWLRPLDVDWAYRDLEATRIRQGEVYYRDFFMHKAPLASYLAAGGQAAAAALHANPVLGTRVVSILLTGMVAALAAWAWANAEGSRAAGVLGGLAFASVSYVGLSAASGIEPKMGMVGAGLAAIVAVHARRWLLAGACSSLAALCWQPGVLFLLAVAAEPMLLAWRGRERLPLAHSVRSSVGPWARMSLGFALPLGLAAAYLASQGALADAWQQAVAFNLGYAERYLQSLGEAVERLAATWLKGHGHNLDLLALAILGLCVYVLKRSTTWPAGRPLLTYGVLAFALSLLNMQDPSDTVPLLPVLAPLAGVAVFRALRWLWRHREGPGLFGRVGWPAMVAVAAVALLTFGVLEAITEELPRTLPQQRAEMQALVYGSSPTRRAFAPGVPQAVVLTGSPALSPYPHLYNGVARWVERTQPGGLAATIAGLEAERPGVVLVAEHPAYDPDYAPMYRWLEEEYGLEAIRIYDDYYLPEPRGVSGALLRLLVPAERSPSLRGVTVGRTIWVWRRAAGSVPTEQATRQSHPEQPPR